LNAVKFVIVLIVLLLVCVGAWIYFHKVLELQVQKFFETPDDRDWRQARTQDTADSYIRYLVAHDTGAHTSEARAAARRFLSVKYTELPSSGQVLVTDGWETGDLTLSPVLGASPDRRPRSFESIREDGAHFVFDSYHDLHPKGTNATFHPRISCAGMLVYRDKRKGVLLSGFDIYLQGTSQSASVFYITNEARVSIESQQQSDPNCVILRYST
jgi:hypothetical protein